MATSVIPNFGKKKTYLSDSHRILSPSFIKMNTIKVENYQSERKYQFLRILLSRYCVSNMVYYKFRLDSK